ncbi:MAG TPA: GNAT family N-acetyltransferase [Actinomycetota bacterium]|nr:GNAT family N-acetyltransferase [Actinomycetota bacterium]
MSGASTLPVAGGAPDRDAVLHDGTTVTLRTVRPNDRDRVQDYLLGMSDETRMLRFGSPSLDVGATAAKILEGTTAEHQTLLAFHGGDDGRVVGGAQYFRMDADHAEVSLSVADDFQGRGLGSILIGRIAAAAAEAGIGTLVASVRPENHRMISVFRESGFDPVIRAVPGMIDVAFATTVTESTTRAFDRRAADASANAVRAFLEPRAVAVIGASRRPDSIGGRLFRNLLRTDLHGVVYPVNPKTESVHGVASYPTVSEIPGPVDVAFVCVPAELVADVLEDCGTKGVRGVVVISAGFSETGDAGAERERRIVDICRRHGMRLIGPNCMGIANSDPEIRLNGTFASTWLLPGHVGFLSQSGALGIAVMEQTARLGIGLSSFVSVGNKADISGNDLLCYWDRDPGTDVILLYLESFGNPRRFASILREISERKPIVVVKSGRSGAGARAASSHTGALLRSSDAVVDALFRQTGAIRTDTLEEMLDVAAVLASQPIPEGNRVGIITNAGGLGILCADAAEARALIVPAFSEPTREALRTFLPPEATVHDPVDMIASATGEDYAQTIRTVAASGEIDALIVIYIPPIDEGASEVVASIREAIGELDGSIPVLTSFLAAGGLSAAEAADASAAPSFPYPEQAAIALARAARLGTWRRRERGRVPRFADARPGEAAAVLAKALERGAGWLEPAEAMAVLDAHAIPVAKAEVAATPEEAGLAAERLRGRVAVKAIGPLHKTDAGAVRLGVTGAEEAEAAASAIRRALAEQGIACEGFVVQEMIEGGVEMLVGVADDPTFGPVLMVGAGGTTAELVGDVAVRLPPLTDVDAREALHSLKTFPLLAGYRGARPVAMEALEELFLRIGAIVEAHPAIVELECNPVTVTAERAVALDVRIRIQAPAAPEGVGSVS